MTDSGSGGASWGPAAGQNVKFGLSTPFSEEETWFPIVQTNADGVATREIQVPAEGAVRLWAQHYLGTNWVEVSQDIPFNVPAFTLTVSDAVYDGNPHGAIATMTDSCGIPWESPVFYYGVYPTSYETPMTSPTNAGQYKAVMYSIDGEVWKPFSIAPAPASVTPNSFTRQYSDPNPELTGTVNGFLEIDKVTDESFNYSHAAPLTSEPREYDISAKPKPDAPSGTPGLGNYIVTYNTGTLKVVKEDAHVSFDPANPATLQASTPGGALNTGALTLTGARARAARSPDGTAAAGEINLAGLDR